MDKILQIIPVSAGMYAEYRTELTDGRVCETRSPIIALQLVENENGERFTVPVAFDPDSCVLDRPDYEQGFVRYMHDSYRCSVIQSVVNVDELLFEEHNEILQQLAEVRRRRNITIDPDEQEDEDE